MDSENGGMLHATTTFLVSFHDFICAVNMQQHEIVPFSPGESVKPGGVLGDNGDSSSCCSASNVRRLLMGGAGCCCSGGAGGDGSVSGSRPGCGEAEAG